MLETKNVVRSQESGQSSRAFSRIKRRPFLKLKGSPDYQEIGARAFTHSKAWNFYGRMHGPIQSAHESLCSSVAGDANG
jgi:hypothetical protein